MEWFSPSENISLNQFRVYAKNNGEGCALLDYRTVAMLQRLFMVYSADRDSQSTIGKGKTELIYESSDAALAINSDDGNYIEIDSSKSSEKSFLVGDTVTVSNELEKVDIRKITKVEDLDDKKGITFEGDFAYITEGTKKLSYTTN